MKILRSAAPSQIFLKIPKPANFLDNFAPLILSKLFSTVNFWCLKVSWKNRSFPGFSEKKVPENFFPGRKFRETSREVDLGQDRPTQRVSAKSVDPNATPMVYFLMQTLLRASRPLYIFWWYLWNFVGAFQRQLSYRFAWFIDSLVLERGRTEAEHHRSRFNRR